MYDEHSFQSANELDRFAIGDRDALEYTTSTAHWICTGPGNFEVSHNSGFGLGSDGRFGQDGNHVLMCVRAENMAASTGAMCRGLFGVVWNSEQRGGWLRPRYTE
jgi:hypothetical protein